MAIGSAPVPATLGWALVWPPLSSDVGLRARPGDDEEWVPEAVCAAQDGYVLPGVVAINTPATGCQPSVMYRR
ncbi:hypothetical protein GCM10022255_035560 [Dactylosporangium darangshiense]|uniref:Secreted protein n=1 Tax=Dactylosporangium darangshiense TaxID=579108 RepID=A0ABP8D8A1_9ACTN